MIELNIDNNLYPNSLKLIPNSPKKLYCEGNIDLLTKPSIAIIGSRNCTENGKKIAEQFAKELSMSGITIISGLAKGIDTVAHTFSYNNLGKTISVLGSGLERIYPIENIPLYQKILENNGLIVSEYPAKEMYNSDNFRARNRIISGLSLGVLVVEATYRSGTSITAQHAISQKRPIFCIPHEIWDSHGVGTNKLIKNGAFLVTSSEDILKILKLTSIKKIYNQLKKNNSFDKTPLKGTKKFKNNKLQQIYDMIDSNNSISVNNIAKLTGFPVNEVLSITSILEIDGYIKKTEGGYVCT